MGPILRRTVRRAAPLARAPGGPILPHPFIPNADSSLGRGGALQPSSQFSISPFYVTDVSIPAYIEYNGTIYYQIHIFAFGNNEWMVSHRYSDFYTLYEKISYWLPCSTTAVFPHKNTFSWILSTPEVELQERIVGLKVECRCRNLISFRHG